jgi:hypothetical protein
MFAGVRTSLLRDAACSWRIAKDNSFSGCLLSISTVLANSSYVFDMLRFTLIVSDFFEFANTALKDGESDHLLIDKTHHFR